MQKITEDWSTLSGSFGVKLERNCIFKIKKICVNANKEFGGILIGNMYSKHYRINKITTPCPFDVQTEVFFERSLLWHWFISLKCWILSNRTETYLGEWHSHLEDHPEPSKIDLDEWKILSLKYAYPLIFLIAGLKSHHMEVWHDGIGQVMYKLQN